MMTTEQFKQTPEQAARHKEAAENKRTRKRLKWVIFCNQRDGK